MHDHCSIVSEEAVSLDERRGRPVKGTGPKQHVPELAIVDGQQRLTSLYAVIKGAEVLRANFKKEKIEIAYNPLSQRFDVADAAIRKDRSYIPNISKLWEPGFDTVDFREAFVEQLSQSRELSKDDSRTIEKSINHLRNLTSYSFTALTLNARPDRLQQLLCLVRARIRRKLGGRAGNRAVE